MPRKRDFHSSSEAAVAAEKRQVESDKANEADQGWRTLLNMRDGSLIHDD
jgi:hypothetical protein